MVKKLALLLVFAAGCKTVTVVTPTPAGLGSETGGATPREAIERFLVAAKNQDVQAIGAAWGDENGATRDHMDRPQFEKRAVILLACTRHDKATIGALTTTLGGRQLASVEFTQGKLVDAVQFTVAKGPSSRWYVQNFEIEKLQNSGHCGKA